MKKTIIQIVLAIVMVALAYVLYDSIMAPVRFDNTRIAREKAIIERISDGEALGDIAVSMNFSSQSYLTDFFRRHTGVVPSAYFKG